MKSRFLSVLSAVMLTASIAVGQLSIEAKAATTAATDAAAVACVNVETRVRADGGCAAALAAAISADAPNLKAMRAAIAKSDIPATKAALLKAGLTEAQLETALIVFESAGKARLKDISIVITCCPLTITIKF